MSDWFTLTLNAIANYDFNAGRQKAIEHAKLLGHTIKFDGTNLVTTDGKVLSPDTDLYGGYHLTFTDSNGKKKALAVNGSTVDVPTRDNWAVLNEDIKNSSFTRNYPTFGYLPTNKYWDMLQLDYYISSNPEAYRKRKEYRDVISSLQDIINKSKGAGAISRTLEVLSLMLKYPDFFNQFSEEDKKQLFIDIEKAGSANNISTNTNFLNDLVFTALTLGASPAASAIGNAATKTALTGFKYFPTFTKLGLGMGYYVPRLSNTFTTLGKAADLGLGGMWMGNSANSYINNVRLGNYLDAAGNAGEMLMTLPMLNDVKGIFSHGAKALSATKNVVETTIKGGRVGNWSFHLPEGEGIYLRQGNKGIIDDAINTGVVKPESVRSNSTRVIERWRANSKVPGDEYDLAYLKGTQWMAEHPNATDDEIFDFIYDNEPGFNITKHFSRNYMFNEGGPFYGNWSQYPYAILGKNRPEINWRKVHHKGHLRIKEPYVPRAENQMGVPTEYMEGYYTQLPFRLGYWFRRFPQTTAPTEYYSPYRPF